MDLWTVLGNDLTFGSSSREAIILNAVEFLGRRNCIMVGTIRHAGDRVAEGGGSYVEARHADGVASGDFDVEHLTLFRSNSKTSATSGGKDLVTQQSALKDAMERASFKVIL